MPGDDEDEEGGEEENGRPVQQYASSPTLQRSQQVLVEVSCMRRAIPSCRQCRAECWQFLGRIPAMVRMPHEHGMRLLELTRRVHWASFLLQAHTGTGWQLRRA
jgi:hypothetical protein